MIQSTAQIFNLWVDLTCCKPVLFTAQCYSSEALQQSQPVYFGTIKIIFN